VPIVVFSDTENKKKSHLTDIKLKNHQFPHYGRYLNRYTTSTNSEHHSVLFRV
jgi:hypothetical protein